MNFRIRSIVPSVLLALGGANVAFLGVGEYLGPGDGIGFLPEIVLAVHLLLGGATFVVGGYAVVYDRPRLLLTMLVGLVTMFLTFILEIYRISTNIWIIIPLGLALIVAALSATWILSEWIFESGDQGAST